MMTISQAAQIAASRRSNFFLQQVNRELPYGDCKALMSIARQQGATITQYDGARFLINNSAWMNSGGCLSPI